MQKFNRDSTPIEKLLFFATTLLLLFSMAAILIGVLAKQGTISPGTWNIPFMDSPDIGSTLLFWGLIGLGVSVVLGILGKVLMK